MSLSCVGEVGAPCRIADQDEASASLDTCDAEAVGIEAHPCCLCCKVLVGGPTLGWRSSLPCWGFGFNRNLNKVRELSNYKASELQSEQIWRQLIYYDERNNTKLEIVANTNKMMMNDDSDDSSKMLCSLLVVCVLDAKSANGCIPGRLDCDRETVVLRGEI